MQLPKTSYILKGPCVKKQSLVHCRTIVSLLFPSNQRLANPSKACQRGAFEMKRRLYPLCLLRSGETTCLKMGDGLCWIVVKGKPRGHHAPSLGAPNLRHANPHWQPGLKPGDLKTKCIARWRLPCVRGFIFFREWQAQHKGGACFVFLEQHAAKGPQRLKHSLGDLFYWRSPIFNSFQGSPQGNHPF